MLGQLTRGRVRALDSHYMHSGKRVFAGREVDVFGDWQLTCGAPAGKRGKGSIMA